MLDYIFSKINVSHLYPVIQEVLTLRNILNYRPLRQGLLGNTNQVKPEQSHTHGKLYQILLPSPQTAEDERFLIYYVNETKEILQKTVIKGKF